MFDVYILTVVGSGSRNEGFNSHGEGGEKCLRLLGLTSDRGFILPLLFHSNMEK